LTGLFILKILYKSIHATVSTDTAIARAMSESCTAATWKIPVTKGTKWITDNNKTVLIKTKGSRPFRYLRVSNMVYEKDRLAKVRMRLLQIKLVNTTFLI